MKSNIDLNKGGIMQKNNKGELGLVVLAFRGHAPTKGFTIH